MRDKTIELLKEISQKLSILIKLFLSERKMQVREKVKLLSQIDLSNKEIAKILDISTKHVAKEKSLLKKEREMNNNL
jgi:DNA-directed RNA polymerase specialized sigma subunit